MKRNLGILPQSKAKNISEIMFKLIILIQFMMISMVIFITKIIINTGENEYTICVSNMCFNKKSETLLF